MAFLITLVKDQAQFRGRKEDEVLPTLFVICGILLWCKRNPEVPQSIDEDFSNFNQRELFANARPLSNQERYEGSFVLD